MKKDSTLSYHRGYKQRVSNYEKSLNVKTPKRGLGNRLEDKEVRMSPREKLEKDLQEAFNSIKMDNQRLLEMRKT